MLRRDLFTAGSAIVTREWGCEEGQCIEPITVEPIHGDRIIATRASRYDKEQSDYYLRELQGYAIHADAPYLACSLHRQMGGRDAR